MAVRSSRCKYAPECVSPSTVYAGVCAGCPPWDGWVSADDQEWLRWQPAIGPAPLGPARDVHCAPWTPRGGASPLSTASRRCGRRFPDHDHRLTDRLIVDALAPCLTRNLIVLVKLPEQPDAVFAMVAGYGDEFIEDTDLVLRSCPSWRSSGSDLSV